MGFACSGCGPGAGDRPNVVLVVIDTLRADRLGVAGFDVETSPALDSLAARGVFFPRVLASSSWTRTSIASLLTSLYPRTLGIFDEHDDALNDRFTTLAEVLWAGGYWTLGATANPNLNRSYHFDQGFDEYTESLVVFPWMRREPDRPTTKAVPLPAGRDLYHALVARLAEEERRPFYVQVNVMEVHEHPSFEERASPEYAALFSDRENADYLRAVRQATDEVVDFVEAVSALPGGEDTLFVVTSDHGEGLGDHPHVAHSKRHGFLLYASHLRVPLLLYHPAGGLPARRVIDAPVRLLDVMPTILDFVGLPGPVRMEGRSLLPLLRGDREAGLADASFAETRFQGRDKVAAYTREWKYIENREAHTKLPRRELQPAGVVEDGGLTDVSKSQPEVVEHFAARVREWERTHPSGSATPVTGRQKSEEIRQLRALGYIR